MLRHTGKRFAEGLMDSNRHEDVKVVGRRLIKVDWDETRRLFRTAAALRPTPDLIPRGVYRFQSFEEAEAWTLRTIARTLVRRRSTTSSASAGR